MSTIINLSWRNKKKYLYFLLKQKKVLSGAKINTETETAQSIVLKLNPSPAE